MNGSNKAIMTSKENSIGMCTGACVWTIKHEKREKKKFVEIKKKQRYMEFFMATFVVCVSSAAKSCTIHQL